MKYIKAILQLIIILLFISTLNANSVNQNLKIGLQIHPPFIIKENGKYHGVSIELWKSVADSLKTKYALVEYELPDLLIAIANGDVDMAISPLTVTPSRIEQFGFTQPYFITNLAYATLSEEDSTFMTLISNIFSIGFLKSLIPLLLIISVFGIIIWSLEHKKNSNQFGKGIHGVGDGIWWSAVTMATVGYGDKTPISPYGRIIGIIWMFTAVIMISGLTASISSSLTVHKLKTKISSFEDLRKSKIGCIPKSGSSDLLDSFGIKYLDYYTVEEGLDAVEKGQIGAFVYDDAILNYYVQKDKFKETIQVIPTSYAKEYFSFASSDYNLIRKVNLILLGIIEREEWERDLQKYNIEYRK